METLSFKELLDKCQSLGLKCYGTKQTMIERIERNKQKLLQALANESAEEEIDLHLESGIAENDHEELIDAFNESNQILSSVCQATGSKKRKRVVTTYEMHDKYDNASLARAAIDMNTFKRERLKATNEGQKEWFQCKHKNCNKRCYLLFSPTDETVSLWFNDTEHEQHDENKCFRGINAVTKLEINKMVSQSICAPSRIQSILRKIELPRLADINESLNPDYVPGIVVPTKIMIRNYVNNTIKPKIFNPCFNYADLTTSAEYNRSVPSDEDESFIMDDFLFENNHVSSGM